MVPYLILYSATAFTISLLFFPVLIKLLTQWKLFDSEGHHKIHQGFTPSMGGVPIVMGIIFSLLIALPLVEWVKLKFFFISLALMFITGLRDDVLTLTPRDKLLSQMLPVIILVVFGDVVLTSFYGPIPGWEFTKVMTWVVSIFSIVIFTNAYNLIDGLDGLAGTIGLIVLLWFGSWFYSIDNYSLSLISLVFAGSILGFLCFNWQPSRVFMGDTGALTIGFLLSFLAIQFVNQNYALQSNHVSRFQASIGTVVCVLIIPVFDTVRIIILRLRKLQSPFRADRNHLHHQFINLGFSHAQSVLMIGGINIFFVILAWLLRSKSDLLILPLVIGICLIINQGLKMATKHGN